MSRIGILTDSTALLPHTPYPGHEFVTTIPLRVQVEGCIYPDTRDPKVCTSLFRTDGYLPIPLAPSVEDFYQAYWSLEQKYQKIITILLSSQLNPAIENARQAAALIKGPATIYIVDSQTTAVGLGFLVQAAAEAVLQDWEESRVNSLVRGLIPHIYTVFCLQSLNYLATSGKIDPAQAVVGEMLGMIPFFIMEGGKLIPVQKARSPRHLVDMLHEFVAEFEHIKHVAIVQGIPPFEQETRNLRDRLLQDLSPDEISEHSLDLALMALLGPRSLGVFTLEEHEEES
jgi:DegV family protein with EDD domain